MEEAQGFVTVVKLFSSVELLLVELSRAHSLLRRETIGKRLTLDALHGLELKRRIRALSKGIRIILIRYFVVEL